MGPHIILAPLRGVTDAVFRNTYAQHFSGIDWAVAPFISTTRGTRIKSSHLQQVLPQNNTRMPVVPQIMSKTAAHFLALATALQDLGYQTVNWNLGCPYPMVAKKGRGSGLLPHPELIEDFLERVMATMANRLSIKLRLGRDSIHEIDALLPIFNRYSIKELIIHPRTGVQMYTGHPDLKAFERCLDQSCHPVVYNGDIVTVEVFKKLQASFPGVSAWMIGRGAVRDPFLPGQIKGENFESKERNCRFEEFHNHLFQRYSRKLSGPSHLLGRMKGLWGYFTNAFIGGRKLRKNIIKTRHAQQYLDTVNRFFDTDPQWKNVI